MQNHLKNQTSPYLLQHAENPVDWYPWCPEAFARAKTLDRPIFLSIGYSTCHWCHVMAHESFEDEQIAQLLNEYFVPIKVDKEERPDIDSIYMEVCQSFTGSGGWPTSIFMTPEQKPFFAGTYFPKNSYGNMIGLRDLLITVHEKWETNREALLQSADEIVALLKRPHFTKQTAEMQLIDSAVKWYKSSFDKQYGGFGDAPKFPAPHNLLFLMLYAQKSGDEEALKMAEKTLMQMYRGGLFDHIGGGFCRYSTDRAFLAPHFEKMLYDNALLMMAYCKAYQLTNNTVYLAIAEKTASYILREMTSDNGGFYSAQDADSDGIEGKYYLFEPDEITELLGEKVGAAFNRYFDITKTGNFHGKNIPNLLRTQQFSDQFDSCLSTVYVYRKNRCRLHLDDKILTSWNGLMIAAMCQLYRTSRQEKYLAAAQKAYHFIMEHLCENGTLFVSFRNGKRGEKGFADEYANMIFALLSLYEATLNTAYLAQARQFCDKALSDFYDDQHGGFFLFGSENEQLIFRPKQTYDGALPSSNSMMAYNLVRLSFLTSEKQFETLAKQQLDFLSVDAKRYPAGFSMFLTALSDYLDPPTKITIVPKANDSLENLPFEIPLGNILCVINVPSNEYSLKEGQTTFYVCKNHSCQPPTNQLEL